MDFQPLDFLIEGLGVLEVQPISEPPFELVACILLGEELHRKIAKGIKQRGKHLQDTNLKTRQFIFLLFL